MKIESLLRRKGGTKVTLDGVEYHFKPGPDGREFADVVNPDHIGIFASIREGYRLANQTNAKEPTPAENTEDDLTLLDRVALANLFTKRFGRPPASALGKQKLIEALQESDA